MNIGKKIATGFMRIAINEHVKKLIKEGIVPTADRVMQDINQEKLGTLLQYYELVEIRIMVEKSIRRQLCKGQNALTNNTSES